MTHQEIQDREIIERYVRHRLTPDERRAFQEHYFACDECFEQVRMTAQFIASVRHSARRGVLAESATEAASAGAVSWWANWFRPMAVPGAAAGVVLALMLGWIIFKQLPGKREDVAHRQNEKQQEKTQEATGNDRRPPENEKNRREKPADQPQDVTQNRPQTTARTPMVSLPTVLLDAARDAKAAGVADEA